MLKQRRGHVESTVGTAWALVDDSCGCGLAAIGDGYLLAAVGTGVALAVLGSVESHDEVRVRVCSAACAETCCVVCCVS